MKAHRRLVWLRRLALAAFVVTVAVTVWLLRSWEPVEPAGRERPTAVASPRGGDSNDGFQWEVTHQGKRYFSIEGRNPTGLEEDEFSLESVSLVLYREDGQTVKVTAEEATYDRTRNEGELHGNVEVLAPGGIELETNRLRLAQRGRILETRSPANFRYGTSIVVEGRSTRIRADLEEDSFVLLGPLRVETVDGTDDRFLLRAEGRLVVLQQDGGRLIRAEGDVFLRSGNSELEAERLAVHTLAESDAIEFIQARSRVKTQWEFLDEEGSTRTLGAETDLLSILMDTRTRQPRKVEMEGRPRIPTAIVQTGSDGMATRIWGRYVQANFQPAGLDEILALGEVMVQEGFEDPRLPAQRVLCGDRLTARFTPSQGLVSAVLDDAVDLHEQGFQVSGQQATVDQRRETASVIGEPVVLQGRPGRVVAPQLVFNQRSRTLSAEGGVATTLEGRAADALRPAGLGESDEPVQVRSEKAFWNLDDSSFVFDGEVQAWQEENRLFADRLRVDQTTSSLDASGEVETHWVTTQEDVPELDVTAGILSFDHRRKRLVYRENVEVLRGQQKLTCQELEVQLGAESGEAERLFCREEVELVDPASGRRVEAELADYDLVAGEVRFEGSPVKLNQKDGGVLEGQRLLYTPADGRVRFSSQAEN